MRALMRVRIGWDGPDGGYTVHGEDYPKEGWRSRVEESEWTFETSIEVEIPDDLAQRVADEIGISVEEL